MLRRHVLALAGAVGGLMMTGQARANPIGLAKEDEAAIRAAIQEYERVWNISDLDAMGRLYAPHVHWVNVKAMHWRGFEEVDRAHRTYFDIMFKGVQQKLLAIESLTPLASNIAVAVVHWHMDAFKTPSGDIAPPHESRMTLVYVKLAEGWKIAHGANIDVDAQAARFAPIRGAAFGAHDPTS